ncbi:MAG: SPOR domain-containing protein [Hyphomicrobiaceae bacterium]|nr:SPOR domain-containing protein [Hyphomicrobiaceae bacterium]
MSRSNGPVTGAGGQPQDWQHAPESDPSAQHGQAPPHQPYHWPALSQQQAPYGYPQGAPQQYDYPPQQPEPQFPAYHYPQDAGGHPHFATPGHHPPFFGPQPAAPAPAPSPYAAQYDRHPGAQQPGEGHYRHYQQPTPAEPQPYSPQPEHRGLAELQHAPQHRHAQTSLRDQLRAAQYDHWQPGQSGQDPHDYDLGSYMPASTAGQPAYGEPPPPGHGGQFDPHWQDPHSYGADAVGPAAGAGAYYAQLGGEALPVAGHPQDPGEHDADDADDDYEETGRGRRGLLIVGALVGAIVVGGGLAYGYKTIVGPAPKGIPPVIKADKRPAKSQPADPGGKQFAHSDSKLMGRLESDGGNAGDSGARQASAAGETDASGVRRVPTVVVGRDGSIAPPAAEPRLPPTTVSVPGMTIVDGFGGRPPPALPPRNVEQAQSPAAAPAPQIIAKAALQPAPPPKAEPEPPASVRSAAVQPAAAAPAPRTPAVRQAAVTPPPAPKSSAVGYVAVLSSQRSRMDALKTFADLQQKYVGVLQNKIPDVQEADLSARGLGTMYRVVVGPPSSREAAADLCGQLKSAGFQGCWITAY